MSTVIDFTTTVEYKNGKPRDRASRESAARRKPRVAVTRDLFLQAAQHWVNKEDPNKFEYAELQPGEIRLLSLSPGKEQEPINMAMFVAKLERAANDYEALSYTWGEAPDAHHSVYITDQNPPQHNAKKTNLAQELVRSRQSLYKIQRKHRWDHWFADSQAADNGDELESRREDLRKLDALMKRLTELLPVEEATLDERKTTAEEFFRLSEQYDRKYPAPVEEVKFYKDRLKERRDHIKRDKRTKQKLVASSTAEPAQSLKPIKSQRFFVRPNLHAALIRLRDEYKPVNIWVDAICINQQSNGRKEKDEQLAQMTSIYGNAKQVVIWLGESDEHTEAASVLIKCMLDFTQLDMLLDTIGQQPHPRSLLLHSRPPFEGYQQIKSEKQSTDSDDLDLVTGQHWEALIDLLRRPWFSRRWIIQEIGMAKSAVVQIGHICLHWDNLADAISVVNDKADELRTRSHFHDAFDDIEGLSASFLVKVLGNACRRAATDDMPVKLMTLETLVCSLLPFDSFYPKDAIYSVLPLASDHPDTDEKDPVFQLRPDFKKSVLDVFIAFVRRSILTKKSLDIICRHWAPAVIKDEVGRPIILPSWISTVRKTPYGGPSSSYGRQYGENFVAFPYGDRRKRYRASKGTKLRFLIKKNSDPLPQQTVSALSAIVEEGDPTPPNSVNGAPLLYDSTEAYAWSGIASRFEKSPSRMAASGSRNGKDTMQQPDEMHENSQIAKQNTTHPATVVQNQDQPNAQDAQDKKQQELSSAEPGRLYKRGRRIAAQRAGDLRIHGIDRTLGIEKTDPATPTQKRQRTEVVGVKNLISTELEADGFILGYVEDLSNTMTDTIDGSWVRRLGWKGDNKNLVPDKLWQTLVAGRDHEGAMAPMWYRRACLHALTDSKVTDENFFIKVERATMRSHPLDDYTRRYLKRVSHVVMKRRFFCGKSILTMDSLVGLVPEHTQTGDVVCILKGCSVPVIMRMVTEWGHELIGEAYVHGRMDGEAVREWSLAHGQTATFIIV